MLTTFWSFQELESILWKLFIKCGAPPKNPIIIKNKKNVAVIVKAASYQEEIENQLYELNNKVLIFK